MKKTHKNIEKEMVLLRSQLSFRTYKEANKFISFHICCQVHIKKMMLTELITFKREEKRFILVCQGKNE